MSNRHQIEAAACMASQYAVAKNLRDTKKEEATVGGQTNADFEAVDIAVVPAWLAIKGAKADLVTDDQDESPNLDDGILAAVLTAQGRLNELKKLRHQSQQ